MYSSAEKLLADTGISVWLDHLPYEEVIAGSGASRSAAYRIWPTKDEFYMDLLEYLAGPEWLGAEGGLFDEETTDIVEQVIKARIDDLKSPEGRLSVLREAVRLGAQRNFEALCESVQWNSYVAIQATLHSLDEDSRDRIASRLRASETSFLEGMTDFYGRLLTVLGRRLKEPMTDIATFTSLGAAVLEGLSLRIRTVPEIIEQTVNFEGQEWPLPAFAYLCLMESITEPVPDYDLDAALAAAQPSGLADS